MGPFSYRHAVRQKARHPRTAAGGQPPHRHRLGPGKEADVADTNTQATEGTNVQTPAAEGSGAETKMFTQDEVNAIVERRIARVKATPPSDYEDLKVKAAKLDELEQANKSELEKAQDAVAKAKAARDEWKAKAEALQAEADRAAAIRAAATEHDVDADMLARMAGDPEENAKFLKARESARPKFGDMLDGGEQPPAGQTLDQIRAIKNPQERIKARAQYHALHPSE